MGGVGEGETIERVGCMSKIIHYCEDDRSPTCGSQSSFVSTVFNRVTCDRCQRIIGNEQSLRGLIKEASAFRRYHPLILAKKVQREMDERRRIMRSVEIREYEKIMSEDA